MAAPNTDSATLVNLVTTAYDRQVRLSLRSVPMFRSVASTKVVDQTHPGSSVVFSIHPEMTAATTALSDNNITDPTGVALADVQRVTVTLNEYGNFTVVSKALREFALDNNLDGNVANLIAYNLANSVDIIVRNVLITTNNNLSVPARWGRFTGTGTSAGSVVTVTSTAGLIVGLTVAVTAGTGAFAAGTTITAINSATTFTVSAAPTTALSGATIAYTGLAVQASSSDVFTYANRTATGLGTTTVADVGSLTSNAVRYVVAQLRKNNVPTIDGQNYVAFIHPSVAADFRQESSASGASAIWAAPHSYHDGSAMYAGEIGTFEGVRFIETPRVPATGDVIDGTTQSGFTTFIMGADALAEAVSEEFGVVLDGVVVDPLKRRMAIGWYGIAGWALFRAPSLWAVKSTSRF